MTGGPALARALSLALSPPDASSLADLARLARALRDAPPDGVLASPLAALADAVPDPREPDAVVDAAAEYEELFGRTVRLSPYEGSYEIDPFRQARRIADVSAFYRAFGAQATGPVRERADHVGCELEFLAFLGLGRAAAADAGDEDAARTCRRAEDLFIEEHLGTWVPALLGAIPGLSGSPLLRAAAAVGQPYLELEVAARGLHPRPLPDRRRSGDMDGDSLACGECPAARPGTA